MNVWGWLAVGAGIAVGIGTAVALSGGTMLSQDLRDAELDEGKVVQAYCKAYGAGVRDPEQLQRVIATVLFPQVKWPPRPVDQQHVRVVLVPALRAATPRATSGDPAAHLDRRAPQPQTHRSFRTTDRFLLGNRPHAGVWLIFRPESPLVSKQPTAEKCA